MILQYMTTGLISTLRGKIRHANVCAGLIHYFDYALHEHEIVRTAMSPSFCHYLHYYINWGELEVWSVCICMIGLLHCQSVCQKYHTQFYWSAATFQRGEIFRFGLEKGLLGKKKNLSAELFIQQWTKLFKQVVLDPSWYIHYVLCPFCWYNCNFDKRFFFYSVEYTITNTGGNTGFTKFTEESISCSSQNHQFTIKKTDLVQCGWWKFNTRFTVLYRI